MTVYFVIDNQNGLVTNAIKWNGGGPLDIEGSSIVLPPDEPVGVWIGWQLLDGEWISPIIEQFDITDIDQFDIIESPDQGV